MKTILKILFKCILLLIILIFSWVNLSSLFRIDQNDSGEYFRNLPENSLDVLILGSSHAQYSMNPSVIYEETGYYSYVLGSSCQPMAMSYKFLEEALKTQKPEVVVLDVFTMMPAQSVCYADGMYYKAIEQMSGMTRLEAADLVDNEDVKYDYMFDLRMNHSNWKRDDFKPKLDSAKGLNPTFGYVAQEPTDFRFLHLIPFQQENSFQLKNKDVKMLNQIINICRENKIKLILMKSPFTIDQENQDALDTIWSYAKTKGIEVIDFLALAEDIGFTLGMDGDTWHNNTWGAEKVSKEFSKILVKDNLIKKHKENSILKKTYEEASKTTAQYLMEKQIDIYKLLEFASKYDCMVAFKYTGSNKSSITKVENELLQNIGLNHDFISDRNKDYYALLKNGEIIKESNKPFDVKVDSKLIEISEDKIVLGKNTIEDLGELEIVFYGENEEWIQDVAIDYSSRYFWKNGCLGWECEEKSED